MRNKKVNVVLVFDELTSSEWSLREYYYKNVDIEKILRKQKGGSITFKGSYYSRSFFLKLLKFKLQRIYGDSGPLYGYISKEMTDDEKDKLFKLFEDSKESITYSIEEIQEIFLGLSNEEKLQSGIESLIKTHTIPPIFDEVNSSQKNEDKQVEQRGIILNNKKYITNPAIGRINEIENLIIGLAQEKKCPIIVGESGVGKTAIVDGLVYMIQNNNVPSFLKDQIIVEVSPGNLLAGTKYRGELEQKLKDLFEIAEKRNLILFIDEFHTIYGGTSENDPISMADILQNHIDRNGLKVIGATTFEEYNKYLIDDSLKRRFEKIIVKEPDDSVLNMIIIGTFENLSKQYNISSVELLCNYPDIIKYLIELTNVKHRVYDDRENNPNLVIGIIDKTYAYARAYDKKELEINHLLKSINLCDRINGIAKREIIQRILEAKPIQGEASKCKRIQFNP